MTVLIGGSVLLIAASAIALVFGWAGASEPLILTSIVASVASAVMLALAYYRSRSEATTTPGVAAPPQQRRSAAETQVARPVGSPSEVQRGDETQLSTAVSGFATAASRPETPSPSKPQSSAPDAEVFVVPSSKKFHRADCRYAKSATGEVMPRSAARRRSYEPCAVCKP